MKRFNLLLILTFLLDYAATAQTVKWTVKPDYDKIDRYSDDLFKCKKGSTLQLVDLSGKPLLDVEADSVTDYDGGYALVLKGTRILGFFSEVSPHRFTAVKGEFYATKYSFFSQGKLVVSSKLGDDGRKGYLDDDGAVFIECKYLEAMPFHKDWAAVKLDKADKVKPYAYVSLEKKENKGCDRLGSFTFATSFNEDGYAFVASYGKYGVINTDFKLEAKADKPKKVEDVANAYDFSYKSKGKYIKESPVNALPAADGSIEMFYELDKWGYRTSQKVMAPAQFVSVKPFVSGYAIVTVDGGKCGIIQYLQGDAKAALTSNNVRVYPGKNCKEISYLVQVPDAIGSNHMVLKVDNGDGVMRNADLRQNEYAFTPYLEGKSDNLVVRAELYSDDGLLLYQKDETVKLTRISISVSQSQAASYADENDEQKIWFTITNNSPVEVEAEWKFKVSGHGNFSGTETLEAGANMTISKKVKVLKDEETAQATVSVTVDNYNCGSSNTAVILRKN